MDVQNPVTPSPLNGSQIAEAEEQIWRDKEERISSQTFDAERRQVDQSIKAEEGELSSLSTFPLQKLTDAGVISPEKMAELVANGVRTLEQLVRWVGEKD